jgi:hypothetical protein
MAKLRRGRSPRGGGHLRSSSSSSSSIKGSSVARGGNQQSSRNVHWLLHRELRSGKPSAPRGAVQAPREQVVGVAEGVEAVVAAATLRTVSRQQHLRLRRKLQQITFGGTTTARLAGEFRKVRHRRRRRRVKGGATSILPAPRGSSGQALTRALTAAVAWMRLFPLQER